MTASGGEKRGEEGRRGGGKEGRRGEKRGGEGRRGEERGRERGEESEGKERGGKREGPWMAGRMKRQGEGKEEREIGVKGLITDAICTQMRHILTLY